MATMTYAAYLKKTGKPSSEATARMWDRLYNNNQRFNPSPAPTATGAQPPAPPAPPAPPPAFNFDGPLDEQGERERTDLDFSNRAGQSRINTDYEAQTKELDAEEPKLAYNRDEGLKDTDANAAGRGLIRSGIRDTNRGKVLRDFLLGSEGLARQRTSLANRRQADLDQLNADYQQNTTNIRTGAIGRRYQRWRDENGGI